MKRIDDLMTRQPWTLQLDDSIAVARRMIAEREIHHLPVLDGGAVVGMVTDRDLALAVERIGTVADVMVPVHKVAGDARLDDVLDAMATQRWDAVVITDDGGVEGIFTASDAVRVLRDALRRRRPRGAAGDRAGPEEPQSGGPREVDRSGRAAAPRARSRAP